MDPKLSFITTDGELIEGLIAYVEISGWYYCFAAFVEEWNGDCVSPPFKLRQPLAIEYFIKIKLGDPKWIRAEVISTNTPIVGEWDERLIDGVRDPEFPALAEWDDDEDSAAPAAESIDQITASEKKILEAMRDGLGARFRWPSSLCQFCLGDAGKLLLEPLPNGLRGYAEKDFEKVLWRWAALPTWARSSYLDRNHSRLTTLN